MKSAIAAGVAVENTAFDFDKLFHYLIPEDLKDKAVPGVRVIVPFGGGNRMRTGIILSVEDKLSEEAAKNPKSIYAVLDEAPLISNEGISLCRYLKDRTFCTYFEAAKAMLPPSFFMKKNESYILSPDVDESTLSNLSSGEKKVISVLPKNGGYISRDSIIKKVGSAKAGGDIDKLAAAGILVPNFSQIERAGAKFQKVISLVLDDDELSEIMPTLTAKQRSVAKVLSDVGSASLKELCEFTSVTPAVVNALVKKGICEESEERIERTVDPDSSNREGSYKSDPIMLTPAQEKVYNEIKNKLEAKENGVGLLHGVTGSGKTKIYLKLIDDIITEGKTAILMVPEISLTPQTLALLYERYGRKTAVFHSGLSIGERLSEWQRVKNGEATIAVGTRSAVFAPLENIGLIIIDEEQEHTYKSDRSPRYHALDVAKCRAAYHGAYVLLTSATPSVESYSAAVSGRYDLYELNERYGNAVLPEVETVDMTREQNPLGMTAISERLSQLIAETLKNGNQVILLINRRGYNTFIVCKSCGKVVTCPYCSISLTYHSYNERLMCHYCGYSEPFTAACKECNAENIRYSGFGTQRVEAELSRLFPDARILRMDADTTAAKNSHKKKLTAFKNKEYDILLGTQMVAKGLDFENVTLVGVISIDQQLYQDDYKSLERAFDLLTQVVGRAGRGEFPGKAVIQTMMPENNIITLAARQDYKAFYNSEIRLRKALIYPPYCDICTVGFTGEDEALVKNAAKAFFDMLREKNEGEYNDLKLIVLGPMTPRIAKISNKYRYRLIIKCRNTKRFREFISNLLISFALDKTYSKVRAYADINPTSLI
ncbi:MAG: primosomal protein N' [Clostridiales bacterium]|jgi:primosomal protein N' (replication factor Y)|nr:primosomal protein N' [Clostridiales bacterium]HPP68384.1 primosomal protein N' [Clostridiales bacterium]HQA05420.1 primosomal protein N' [Clostridiales bacterium]HXK83908.1 primosomal protein N' [Clostridiales bacterium]